MSNYNYLEAVKDDVRTAIKDGYNLEEWRGNADGLEQQLNNDLWIDDSVTGNASGSYFCNSYKAEECLCHNLDLLVEACREFGAIERDILKDGAEACDVTIRCYLLGQAIAEVLEELEEELEEE